MRKLSTAVIFSLLCWPGHAATTCLHNRTAVFIIKKSVDPVSVSSNASEMTFSMTLDYETLPGQASSKTLGGLATCNEITTDTSDAAAKTGSANVYLRASSADVGTQCWCSLTGPVTTWWVYLKAFDSEDACQSGCAAACAKAAKANTDNFRTNGLYQAIW